MSWLAISVVLGLASWIGWQVCVTALVVSLQRRFPDVYTKVGSPTVFWLWSSRGLRRSVPKVFDEVTLNREYRTYGITDHRILLEWNLAFLLRWAQMICLLSFALALLASAFGHPAP